MSNVKEEHKIVCNNYLVEYVNPILEQFIIDILKMRPKSLTGVVQFMQNWSYQEALKIIENIKQPEEIDKINAYGEMSESDQGSEDEMDEMSLQKIRANKASKISVSAEAFGMFNKKKEYVPKVINKTDDQKKRMKQRLEQSFLFNTLSIENQIIVIDAFEEKRFKEGDVIIQQGDDGNELFLVDEGQLDCFKKFKKDEDEKHIKIYEQGEAFGELALLYNAPRAATIKAKTECVLFSLDRECFNGIVKEAAQKKRQYYEQLLENIEILSTIDTYERQQIADALKTRQFKEGDFIVKEGDRGESFFFLEQGEAIATKTVNMGEDPIQVYEYKKGDYFGELALLKDQPRAANIIAKTDCIVAELDRQSFKRLLGPLEDLLKRNFSRYSKFVS